MAPPFKIPKRSSVSQREGADCVVMQSPLSRLQDGDQAQERPRGESSADPRDTRPSGKAFCPSGGRSSVSLKPPFRDTVKSFLGLQQPVRGPCQTSPPALPPSPSPSPRHPAGTPPFCLSNGWRPKRASDRLSTDPSSLKERSGASDRSMGARGVSLDLDACDAAPSGPSSSSFWTSRTRTTEPPVSPETGPGVQNPVTDGSSESSSSDCGGAGSEGLLSPPLRPSPGRLLSKPWPARTPSPSAGAPPLSEAPRTPVRPEKAERPLSLNRTSWMAASTNLRRHRDEQRERERRPSCMSLTLRMGTGRDSATLPEPIVLSSEEEDVEQGEALSCGPPGPGSGLRGAASTADRTTPPLMELDFTDLHVGLTRAQPNGTLTITEHSITLPLKGGPADGGGECEVVVVASQVRGHGLWDWGVAGRSPALSLLFLWVTDAQAKLLQTELSIIHPVSEPGVSCVFVLVVVSVSELQAALCLSLLDTQQYCSSSPLDLSQAASLLSSLLPPPLHTHLLLLLGPPMDSSNQRARSSLGQRVIQYPAPPSRGRITVTTEDLACLKHGQFLNDVIIDFYLKYLLLQKVEAGFSERCHVFSSFFFKQLTRRRAQGEDALLYRELRHQRVKTWTRHVDIFTKDFLFVPVNQEAHWYLLVICFPGLDGVQHQDWAGPDPDPDPDPGHQGRGGADKSRTKPSAFTLSPPECSQAGCERARVLKRPCILVMDSLKLSAHENACRLLRDYLKVEWQVRRGTSRLFTADTMCSAVCLLPLQDNSSDCGLYLLQYAESFLQNPVVHFDLPVRLEGWFPRQQIRSKRDQIKSLILDLQQDQNQPGHG